MRPDSAPRARCRSDGRGTGPPSLLAAPANRRDCRSSERVSRCPMMNVGSNTAGDPRTPRAPLPGGEAGRKMPNTGHHSPPMLVLVVNDCRAAYERMLYAEPPSTASSAWTQAFATFREMAGSARAATRRLGDCLEQQEARRSRTVFSNIGNSLSRPLGAAQSDR